LPHLLFTGFKGCGKTTIGRKVARRLGLEFVDLDNVIENLYAEKNPARLSFREIFQAIGAEAFRRLELEAARRVAERAARRVAERAARRVAERAARRTANPESGAGSRAASGAPPASSAPRASGAPPASSADPAPGAPRASGASGLLIALGGGALMNPDTRQVLRGIGRIVYLKTSMKEILRRARVRGFPAFIKAENPEAEFVRIFQEREPMYLECADVAVDIGTAGPEDAAELVIAAIGQD
jgi:shikimate kinase